MGENVSGLNVEVRAVDGYKLGVTVFEPQESGGQSLCGVVMVAGATAVPQTFYRHFASAMSERRLAAVTFDYRGVGRSRQGKLKGFPATAEDWVLHDMQGVVDWIFARFPDHPLYIFGHSFGGQTAGLLERRYNLQGMVTVSAQSGYWLYQGGLHKLWNPLVMGLLIPVLTRAFGYFPWSWLARGEDLPAGFALQWSRWCRSPHYLNSDTTLPLHRYRDFDVPVLAHSVEDDPWGSFWSVDVMMRAYPMVVRSHLEPRSLGLAGLGHMGYFRKGHKMLWERDLAWLMQSHDKQARLEKEPSCRPVPA